MEVTIAVLVEALRAGKILVAPSTVAARLNAQGMTISVDEVEQLAELPVTITVPMDKNVLRSLALKTPVVLFDQSSPASRQFYKLAGKLIGEEYRPETFLTRFMRFLGLAR